VAPTVAFLVILALCGLGYFPHEAALPIMFVCTLFLLENMNGKEKTSKY
jgi:hypothetical protein